MDQDLLTIKYADFEYGHQLPSHLEFLDKHKPSWLKIFEDILPHAKGAKKFKSRRVRPILRNQPIDASKRRGKTVYKTGEQKRKFYQSLQKDMPSTSFNEDFTDNNFKSVSIDENMCDSPVKLQASFMSSNLSINVNKGIPRSTMRVPSEPKHLMGDFNQQNKQKALETLHKLQMRKRKSEFRSQNKHLKKFFDLSDNAKGLKNDLKQQKEFLGSLQLLSKSVCQSRDSSNNISNMSRTTVANMLSTPSTTLSDISHSITIKKRNTSKYIYDSPMSPLVSNMLTPLSNVYKFKSQRNVDKKFETNEFSNNLRTYDVNMDEFSRAGSVSPDIFETPPKVGESTMKFKFNSETKAQNRSIFTMNNSKDYLNISLPKFKESGKNIPKCNNYDWYISSKLDFIIQKLSHRLAVLESKSKINLNFKNSLDNLLDQLKTKTLMEIDTQEIVRLSSLDVFLKYIGLLQKYVKIQNLLKRSGIMQEISDLETKMIVPHRYIVKP